MSETLDIIVLGAGPAGSSCARRAAELGLTVAVLEKSTFPRHKPCGAGLTDKALRLLNGEQEPVERGRFHAAEIAFGRHLSLIVSSKQTLVATTTRRELDSLLARSAEAAGARLDYGRAVTGIEEGAGVVKVSAGSDSLTAHHVVAADGARGDGRRMLDLSPVRMGGAAYVHAFPASSELPERYSERVLFDLTAASRGYGWIFPKGDHLNVGIFSQHGLSRDLTGALDRFLGERGLAAWRTRGPFAFPIPESRPPDALGTGRVLFAGDAAGLTNPVTGEGISSAILSGRAAAEAVAESLNSGATTATLYARRVEAEVIPMVDGSRKKGDFAYALGPGFMRFAARTPVLRAMIGPVWRAATRDNDAISLTVTARPANAASSREIDP